MYLFASFGDAVSSPDGWQMTLGGLAVLAVRFLAARNPMIAVVWSFVEKLLLPAKPVAPPDPSKPVEPAPVEPDLSKLSLKDVIAFFKNLLAKKRAEVAELEATLQEAKA